MTYLTIQHFWYPEVLEVSIYKYATFLETSGAGQDGFWLPEPHSFQLCFCVFMRSLSVLFIPSFFKYFEHVLYHQVLEMTKYWGLGHDPGSWVPGVDEDWRPRGHIVTGQGDECEVPRRSGGRRNVEERSTTFAGEEERSQRKSVALGSQRPGGTEDGESLQGTIGKSNFFLPPFSSMYWPLALCQPYCEHWDFRAQNRSNFFLYGAHLAEGSRC